MKKKMIMTSVFGVLVMGVAGYWGLVTQEKMNADKLLLASVEALTQGESTENNDWGCDGTSASSCSVECGVCGSSASGTGASKGDHRCQK